MSSRTEAVDGRVRGELVFKIRDVVRDGVVPELASADDLTEGMQQIINYVSANHATSLVPLKRARLTTGPRGRNWDLGHSADAAPPGSGTFLLRLARLDDETEVLKWLKLEKQQGRLEYVERPGLYFAARATLVENDAASLDGAPVDVCRFSKVWDILDTGTGGGEVAVIDDGRGGLCHSELEGRIVQFRATTLGPQSEHTHCGSVAAVISAHRDDPTGAGGLNMRGCCSAQLRVFNAWTESNDQRCDRLDYKMLNDVLVEIAEAKVPVLNLSMTAPNADTNIKERLAECIERGVAVVAAAGNGGKAIPPLFPASFKDVIAVGALAGNDRLPDSSVGREVFMCAPGESVMTTFGNTDYLAQSGTSFSAAMVSAAVWLARRNRRLTVQEVRDLLAISVSDGLRVGGREREFGHGRLDMVKLNEHLRDFGSCL